MAPPVSGTTSLEVPSFVLKHAPLVWLCSQEQFWPADVEDVIKHCRPSRKASDGVPLDSVPPEIEESIQCLSHQLVNDEACYLTSIDDIRNNKQLAWLQSKVGIPNEKTLQSTAPCWLITVDKGDGIVDAFWFFYYAFNLGPTVFNIHFGNHVSDWEHCMIRFKDGQPQAAHLSSHSDGFAYTWESLEKDTAGERPIIYSAKGSHAMYPTAASYRYSVAKMAGPIDLTDRGKLWDPRKKYYAFRHKFHETDNFEPYDPTKAYLVGCLAYRGKWGNKFSLPASGSHKSPYVNMMRRAKCFVGLDNWRWGDGVTGPRDKGLDRIGMNQLNSDILRKI